MFAPGNLRRAAYFPHSGEAFTAMGLALKQSSQMLLTSLSDARLYFAALSILLLQGKFRPICSPRIESWAFTGGLLGIPVIVFLGFFISAFATGELAQPRTGGGIYFFVLLIAYYSLVATGNRAQAKLTESARRCLYHFAVAGFGISLLFGGNAGIAWSDYLGTAKRYDGLMKERYEMISRFRNEGVRDVCFPKIPFPQSFYVEADLLEDPFANRNKNFAQLVGFTSVRISGAAEPKSAP